MAQEEELFADAKGGASVCIARGQRENKGPVPTKVEVKPKNKPIVSCRICGKAHFTN